MKGDIPMGGGTGIRRGYTRRSYSVAEYVRPDGRRVAAHEHAGGTVASHVNHRDGPYPLVCVCETPVPEWVYVAHQCANCKRLITETP